MIVILDTNLLLLFVVGSTSRDYIDKHKRLRHEYTISDFDLLTRLLANAKGVLVSPHILAETSNLLRQIADPARSAICEAFKALIGSPNFDEIFVEGKVAAERPEFVRLGLTDSGILQMMTGPRMLLTA